MPDVNVIVALLDGLHVHHGAAKQWFDSASRSGWATCPLTISGGLRVLSRPQPIGGLSVEDAGSLLTALIEANIDTHEFWTDSVDLLDDALFDLSRLQGYRQVTDIHLLALAYRNHGVLVTLDTGLTAVQSAVRANSPQRLKTLAH